MMLRDTLWFDAPAPDHTEQKKEAPQTGVTRPARFCWRT
jgi:hypothetical protein